MSQPESRLIIHKVSFASFAKMKSIIFTCLAVARYKVIGKITVIVATILSFVARFHF